MPATWRRASEPMPRPRFASARPTAACCSSAELEADVNNGGFAQYLDNKGLRRAGEALQALRRVGATATSRLLVAALKPSLSEVARNRLDDRFYKSREDLAYLASRTFNLVKMA